MFPTKIVEKIKTYILHSVIFSPVRAVLRNNVEKNDRVRHATGDNVIWQAG